MNRLQPYVFILSLALAALACTLTQPTGAELAPQLPSPTMAPTTTQAAPQILRLANTPTPSITPSPSPLYCVVESDALNIRACAGLDCPVIAWAMQGERLLLLEAGPWANTPAGWINTTFCTLEK